MTTQQTTVFEDAFINSGFVLVGDLVIDLIYFKRGRYYSYGQVVITSHFEELQEMKND